MSVITCRRLLLALLVTALFCPTGYAWWDTVVTTVRPVPLLQEIEAEACTSLPAAALQTDSQADGGKGGKAVLLAPGGATLRTQVELKNGLYSLFVIARDPQGKVGRNLMTLQVHELASGQKRSWTMMTVHREAYFAVASFYFPAYAGGKYELEVSLAKAMDHLPIDKNMTALLDPATLALKDEAPTPLLVDRLEVRDVLGNCARQAVKTKRMLTSDQQLAEIRAAFAQKKTALPFGPERFGLGGATPSPYEQGRSPAQWQQRGDELWKLLPDFNEHLSHSAAGYGTIIGRDRNGTVADGADAWEKTGNAEIGWDAAVMLCALAEKYPAIDYWAQGLGKGTNLTGGQPFRFNNPAGKSVYRGWAGPDCIRLVTSYDKLFDYVKGNQELATFVGSKIPGIKTPQDVIRFLDSNLLQHSMDASDRDVISGGDNLKVIIPLVQGVSELSNQMLEKGIFSKMNMNMTFRGGVDDQAICSYSRDGVHYIGSVGYLSNDLQEIAELLHRYCAAGGPKRFDLQNPTLYPQMSEAQNTLAQLRLAGGFRMLVGDAGDLRNSREATFTAAPGRILGGFGASILESGQFGGDPLAMRGVGLYFGIGRGHSHQDTLNLELFAHGCRVSPDLGGRHEPPHKGSPNMRWNKVHNLVEVDETNFENRCPGSTVSGTGWNTSFAPVEGAAFMEHQARAVSHPQVSLYQRQTAMIDVGEADSYYFDVFRVKGGKVHTWCFHGGPTEKVISNTPLETATSATALQYLRDHFQGTRQEGTAPDRLQVDWPMRSDLQKHYQGAAYQADRQVVTRVTLLGAQGQKVMVGNASSDMYNYNFPFLYVQGRQEEAGRESVYPAIIEPFAGKPFITATELLSITPQQQGAQAAVAVKVTTAGDAVDTLYAGGGEQAANVVGELRVRGKFAMVSVDAQGLRLAELAGGTQLSGKDVSIVVPQATYRAAITAVDYAGRSFTVDQALPEQLLVGALAGLGNSNLHSFRLARLKVDGSSTRISHDKTAKYYQSTIVDINEKEPAVETEIEPVVYGPDIRFADGTTVSNEAGNKFWRATLSEGDRWMHMGWPGYRGSWPNTVRSADMTDADGDGAGSLTILGDKGEKDAAGNSLEGKPILKLEVTRESPDGQTFYFKLPSDPAYQRGGWQFANRTMYNEDQSRMWLSSYPGSSYLWKLQGAVSKSDFSDADGNGKVKLSAFLFGPGDSFQVDCFVQVRRQAAGTFQLRSNTACTIGLPAALGGKVSISGDEGKTFRPLPAKVDAGRLVVSLSAGDLGAGTVLLRVDK